MLEAGTFPSNRPTVEHSVVAMQDSTAQQISQIQTRSNMPVVSALGTHLATRPSVVQQTTMSALRPHPSGVDLSGLQYFRNQTIQHHKSGRVLLPETPVQHQNVGSTTWPPKDHSLLRPEANGHTPSIDLYTPRPSTAPAQVSQHLSQLLPPPRELPFKTKTSQKRKADETRQMITQDERCLGPERQLDNDVIVPDSQEPIDPRTISPKLPRTELPKPASKTAAGSKKARRPAYKCDACK